ncbi:hypothetical protein ACH5AO_24360 [Streptomyces sp. NPDC018964]
MTVPCIVKDWSYCSADTIWRPGRTSSARTTMASAPLPLVEGSSLR